MPSPNKLANEFIIDNLDTLKVAAHALRLDILQILKEPKSVKEIAKQIDRPATKLYYHVNLMEEHGLIRVVETNIVSGILEKKYQVVARNYRLHDNLFAESDTLDEDVDGMLGAIFDVTRAEIKRSIQADQMKPSREDRRGLLWRSSLRLTAEQFAEFYSKLDGLLKELDEASIKDDSGEEAADQQLFGITVAYYPVVQTESEGEE